MNVNTVVFALLVMAGLPTSGFAAVMPDTANQQAFIFSRDASSRFLAVSYMPGQRLSDDGFSWANAPATDHSTEFAPVPGVETSQSGLAALQASSRSGPSLSDALNDTSRFVEAGQDGIARTLGSGSGGLNTLAPVTTLSTVPLPASSALFGAALLALAGLGHGLRMRVSRQV